MTPVPFPSYPNSSQLALHFKSNQSILSYYCLSYRKYADLNAMEIPVTESLQDTMERTLPLFQDRILPDLMSGNTVMIMAHANSIRGIVKHLDNLTVSESLVHL